MAGVLVHCAACGFSGPAQGLVGVPPGMSVTVTFSRSSLSCPACGNLARVLDGTFEIRDGLIEILAAPDWSMQALRQLLRAAEKAQELADQDVETAISLVAKASTSVGAFLRRANAVEQSDEMGGLKAILKWIAYAVAGILGVKAAVHAQLTAEEVARLVDEALRLITG